MNELGVVKLSYEMVDSLELLTPWKDLSFRDVLDIIKKSEYKIDGFVFLSTCNRVEVIYKIQNSEEHLSFYNYLLENLPQVSVAPELITGRPVALHLLKLATGLESMVVGETEIRHQLKEAVQISSENQCLDSILNQLFQNVFRESKILRTEMPSNIPLSVVSIGIRNLEEKLGGFASRKEWIVVIGAGKMSKASIGYIKKWGGTKILWVNRTLEKILKEGNELEVQTLSLTDFLEQTNIQKKFREPICAIITATSAKEPFLTKEVIEKINYKKLVLLDLAFPANIKITEELPNVTMINLQTIKEQLEFNKKRREEAIKNMDLILLDSLYKVETNWITSIASPVLREIQEKVHYHSRKRLEMLFEGNLKHLKNKDKRILYDWAIQFHKDMNRIHKVGIEQILKHYLTKTKTNY